MKQKAELGVTTKLKIDVIRVLSFKQQFQYDFSHSILIILVFGFLTCYTFEAYHSPNPCQAHLGFTPFFWIQIPEFITSPFLLICQAFSL